MNSPRVLFYIQHLLGIGHMTRAATLTRGLEQAGFDVTMVSGGMSVPGLDIGKCRFIQLPPTRATDVYFKQLVDEFDQPIDDAWKERRAARLMQGFDELQPDIIVTELFPFGRRQLRFELLPMLEAAKRRASRPLIVSSVRDILVESPKPERTAEMLERIEAFYDLVLVHGDPELIPFERTFAHATSIQEKLAYTGYVVDRRGSANRAPTRDGVIVSAGGGAVSEPLLEAALDARPQTVLRDAPWRFLVGHNLPEPNFRRLEKRAGDNVVIERARPDFVQLMQSAALSISQGGYNTVMETLDARTRAVIVPYAGGLETEQTLRAKLLVERGVLTVVEEAELDAQSLAHAVNLEMARPEQQLVLDTGGVEATAAILRSQLASPPEKAPLS